MTHPDRRSIYPKADPNQTEKKAACAARRSFLMTELRTGDAQTDYSSLRKDSDLFHSVARQLRQSER